MSSLVVLSILGVSALVTSFISGILGMAGGMILMGVLLAVMSLPAAMMMHGISQLAANGWRALMLRGDIDWRVIRGYSVGAAAAIAIFAMLQIVVSKPVALIFMGITPFITLALPEKLVLNVERPWHSSICGTACVTLNLTAGIAGPLLDVFFVRSAMTRQAVVATKAATQTLNHILKVAYFGMVIAVGDEVTPWLIVMMVVLAFIGTSLSKSVLERISDATFRQWTRRTVMAIGVVYLASGLRLAVG